MSVARCLGVEDVDGELMVEARLGWGRWCRAEPGVEAGLAVVDDLLELPGWTRTASRQGKDRVLARLSWVARGEQAAAIALAWLLCPAAARLAQRLADRSGDIDALVAGQLWVEVCAGRRVYERSVAANIMTAVRDAVRAELGVGRAARRADPTWFATSLVGGVLPDGAGDAPEGVGLDASQILGVVVHEAVLAGAITRSEAGLLWMLAREADEVAAPARRGRGGLTSPQTVARTSALRGVSTHTIRRRVAGILDRLRAHVRAHIDLAEMAQWYLTHEYGPVPCAELMEIYEDEAILAMLAGAA